MILVDWAVHPLYDLAEFGQLSECYIWHLFVSKKNLAGGGMTAPAVLCDREDRLTPAKKIPEPLPHPYTAAP